MSTIVNGAPGAYSAVIQSVDPGRQVYVGRSMYLGDTGGILTGPGHQKIGMLVAPGATLPTQWYFAEGARVWARPDYSQFSVYYIVFNPNETAATVTVEFFSDTGGTLLQTVTTAVPARTRLSVSAADYPALSGKSFSARVTSTQPVIAERSMYWGATWTGGHAERRRIDELDELVLRRGHGDDGVRNVLPDAERVEPDSHRERHVPAVAAERVAAGAGPQVVHARTELPEDRPPLLRGRLPAWCVGIVHGQRADRDGAVDVLGRELDRRVERDRLHGLGHGVAPARGVFEESASKPTC